MGWDKVEDVRKEGEKKRRDFACPLLRIFHLV